MNLLKFISRHASAFVILTAIVSFLFPALFGWVRGNVSSLILGFIMLTMGLTLSANDFKVLIHRPQDIGIGAVAQFTETASTQNLVLLRQCSVSAVLVHEVVHTLRVEEVLNLLAILLLPFAVSTAPFIIQRDVHGHTPRVVTEIVAAVAATSPTLHLAAVKLAHVRIQTSLLVDGLVEELA